MAHRIHWFLLALFFRFGRTPMVDPSAGLCGGAAAAGPGVNYHTFTLGGSPAPPVTSAESAAVGPGLNKRGFVCQVDREFLL